MTKVVRQLNQVIGQSVTAAHLGGVNVKFVPTYSAFRGHGPCDAPNATALYLNSAIWGGPTGTDVSPESLHPNALGQYGFARLILQHL